MDASAQLNDAGGWSFRGTLNQEDTKYVPPPLPQDLLSCAGCRIPIEYHFGRAESDGQQLDIVVEMREQLGWESSTIHAVVNGVCVAVTLMV